MLEYFLQRYTLAITYINVSSVPSYHTIACILAAGNFQDILSRRLPTTHISKGGRVNASPVYALDPDACL